MSVVLAVVLPVFGLVAAGYLATFAPAFDAAARRGLTVFVFTFALPASLFRTTLELDVPAFRWGFLAAYFASQLAVFALGVVLGRKGGKPLDESAILAFGGAYSNMVLLGIPLVAAAFGPAGDAPVVMLIAAHSPVTFPLVIILAEVHRGRGASLLFLPLAMAKGLAANTIFMSLVLGLIGNRLGLHLPAALDSMAEGLGRAAGPCALFVMGAGLRARGLRGGLRDALPSIVLKTVVLPALVYLLAVHVFALDPLWAAVAVVVAALPAGVNVYLFAERYQAGAAAASATIVVTTLLSVATLTGLLALFRDVMLAAT